MSLTPVIEARNLHKIYERGSLKVKVLEDVSLKIFPGELVALTGKSGAGKSTLLHILGGLDSPSSGSVHLLGKALHGLNDGEKSRLRSSKIGFIFQMNNLILELSALENVLLPGLISGYPLKKIEPRARELLQKVGLTHRWNHHPAELSGGEQQRVAIARSLLLKPAILLADEPTGNLDQKTSLMVQELLLSLCQEEKSSMLLVTHDSELAGKLPYHKVMEDGRLLERNPL